MSLLWLMFLLGSSLAGPNHIRKNHLNVVFDAEHVQNASAGVYRAGPKLRSFFSVDILGRALENDDCIFNVQQLDVMFMIDVGARLPMSSLENLRLFIMSSLKPLELGYDKIHVGIKSMGAVHDQVTTITTLNQGISHRAVQDGLTNSLQRGNGNFNFTTAFYEVEQSMESFRTVSKVVVFIVTDSVIYNIGSITASPILSKSHYSFYYITVAATSTGNIGLLPGDLFREESFLTLALRSALFTAWKEKYGCNHCASKPCAYGEQCIPQDDPNNPFLCDCPVGSVSGACDPCRSNPCRNGTCITTGSSYTCDPCVPQPCMNGGKCFKVDGAAHCGCLYGYVGAYCQHQCPVCQSGGVCTLEDNKAVCRCLDGSMDETCACNLVITCLNGGSCYFKQGQPACQCKKPFYGTTCAELCDENTCLNGGKCGVVNSAAICDCPARYHGEICELDKCDSYFECKNGGVCELHEERYHVWCNCKTPFTGVDCSISPCSLVTCHHGGVCKLDSGDFAYCDCPAPFSGGNCEDHPCDAYICENQGTCLLRDSYNPYCKCLPNFSGERCQLTPCSLSPCQNNGVCEIDTSNNVVCICKPPYRGRRCRITPCSSDPCKNGGICQINNGGFVCECLPLFSGRFCKDNMCTSNPCLNGGTCQLNVENYPVCSCTSEFIGDRCQTHRCDIIKCDNGGECAFEGGRPVCVCPPQFSGNRCQLTPCVYHSCFHDGTCFLTTSNAPQCLCSPPFTGINCETTPCTVNPCINGGTCEVDAVKNFKCFCPNNYYGERCELDPCSNGPCYNEGQCQVTAENTFFCTCVGGYWGKTCLYNPCTPNPCNNGGECISVPSRNEHNERTFQCNCTNAFTGPRCSTPVEKSSDSVCNSNPCTYPCTCKPSCRHAGGYLCVSKEGRLGKNCSIAPALLKCGMDRIEVSMNNELLVELQGSAQGNGYFYLARNESLQPASFECRSRTSFVGSSKTVHKLSIPSPFTSCGTSTSVNREEQIVISNKVWFNIDEEAAFFDMIVPVLLVHCNYSAEYNVSTSINPIVDENHIELKGSNNLTYPVQFELCKAVSTCLPSCPSFLAVLPGAVYTVGQFINVIVKPPMVSGKSVDLLDFYISCGERRTVLPELRVIKDGCPTNTIPCTVFTTTTSICIMFQVHRLQKCNVIYLHALLAHCEGRVQSCGESNGLLRCVDPSRKRRSLEKIETFGPIFIIPLSENENRKSLPQKSKKKFLKAKTNHELLKPVGPAEDIGISSIPFIVFCFSCSLLLVVILVTVFLRRSYCKDTL